jgi:nicotinamidase-related amidase
VRTALLIIDIQNDYFPGGKMELDGSMQAAAAATRLLAAFRREKWPVYHVRHVSLQSGATFFCPGTPGAESHQSVTPLPCEPVILKHYPNSFRETALLEQLKSSDIGSLLICGMMSHMCVDATVRAAFDLGFDCILAHDACATRGLSFNGVLVPAAQVQAAYMAALGTVYAQVKAVDEIMANMTATF